MTNLFPDILTNFHMGFSPMKNVATAICSLNGQTVPCGDFGGFFSGLMFSGIIILSLVALAVTILTMAGMWKAFKKAGQPGWAAIIPIYNIIVMLQIIKKPLWWIVFYFIPFVNAVISVIALYYVSKVFGKGVGFTIGLIFLPFVFYPILGFGDAVYEAPVDPQHV